MTVFNTPPVASETCRRLVEYYGWPTQYFTGADVSFTLMDAAKLQGLGDVAAVGYTAEERIAPMRNYDDYYYNYVAYGDHIIMGTIALYYVKMNFLLEQVQHFYSDINKGTGESEPLEEPAVQAAKEEWWGPEARGYEPMASRILSHQPFNLLISIGPAADRINLSKVIMDVSLASSSVKYANDDQPIIEEYQFIAKRVINLSAAVAATDVVSDDSGLSDAMNTEPTGERVILERQERGWLPY